MEQNLQEIEIEQEIKKLSEGLAKIPKIEGVRGLKRKERKAVKEELGFGLITRNLSGEQNELLMDTVLDMVFGKETADEWTEAKCRIAYSQILDKTYSNEYEVKNS